METGEKYILEDTISFNLFFKAKFHIYVTAIHVLLQCAQDSLVHEICWQTVTTI